MEHGGMVDGFRVYQVSVVAVALRGGVYDFEVCEDSQKVQ